jgi:hypothetical protein
MEKISEEMKVCLKSRDGDPKWMLIFKTALEFAGYGN